MEKLQHLIHEDSVPSGYEAALLGNRILKFGTNAVTSSSEVQRFDNNTLLPSKRRKSITQRRSAISQKNGISNHAAT